MTTFLLVLIILLLGYVATVQTGVISLLTRLTADVESMLDFVSKEKAKDVADELIKAGYVQVKKDK
jgi:hypothetical protein